MNTRDLKYLPLGGLLHLAAYLPLWVLYGFADLIFVVMYHIWGYRKKIVFSNLRDSFPDKEEKELRRIARRFYRNLADQVVETVKLLHISDRQMRRRMTFNPDNIRRVDGWLREGRPVVAYFSHCFNWEWAPSITLWSSLADNPTVAFCQIYRPLRNNWADALMLRLRGRFGAVSLPKKVAFLDLLRYRRKGVATITGFMSDQHPSHGDPGYITTFLNHPTAMITGTETVARRLDAAVVYWDMHKNGRGRYHIDMHLITDTPGTLPEGEITSRYAAMLQRTVERDPAGWLWSHNRWKNPVKTSDDETR